MRLDKYLKCSRLIKRRTVAKDACDGGRVTVNGKTAKAGTDIFTGDVIKISFGNREIIVRVIDINEHVNKEEACMMYEEIK